jgi:CHAT domain-containing protein/Tfp pilus assembly protein PilF
MLSLVMVILCASINAHALGFDTSQIVRIALKKDPALAKEFFAAQALWERGKWNESGQAWQVLFEKTKKRYGDGHIITGSAAFYLGDTYREQQLYTKSLPPLTHAVNASERYLGEDKTTASYLMSLGLSHFALAQYDKALPLQKRTLSIYAKALDPEHPDTAYALLALASTYSSLGRHQEALPLQQRALSICENVLGKEHFRTGVSLNNLSETYRALARHKDALPLQQRSIKIFEKILGHEHVGLAASIGNLALIYREIAQYDQALPLQLRALAIFEKNLGSKHERTALGLTNLATTFAELGQHEKALPLLERALAIFENAFGHQHPDTAVALNNLAETHRALAQYEKALPLYKRSLEIFEKSLGPEHSKTALGLMNLAANFGALANFDEELPLQIRALKINEKALGLEHPNTAQQLISLATTYSNLSRHEEAVPMAQRAVAIYEKILGSEHPSTAMSLDALSSLYSALAKYDQALPLQQRALIIYEKTLGASHPSTALSLSNMASMYRFLGVNDKAVELQQRALAINENRLGPEHPDTARDLNNLALSYGGLGQHEKALPLQRRALAIFEKVHGPEHPSTAKALNNLGLIYSETGSHKKALTHYQEALSIDLKIFGEEHESTALTLNNLAEIHRKNGDLDTALSLQQRSLTVLQKLLGSEHPTTAVSLGNLALIYLDNDQPDAGIIFLKSVVNIHQSLRERVSSLGAIELQGYTQSVSSSYQVLASVLTEQGRLAEAQLVLDMLKENEQFEFIRRSNDADPRRNRIGYNTTEQAWINRYRQIAGQIAALGAEEQALQKQSKLGLTSEQKKRQQTLKNDLVVARKAFESFLDELRDSFAKQGTARTIEVLETTQQALRETQALLKGLGNDTVLLQYYVTEDKVGMLLTTSGVQLARTTPIKSKELNRQINEFRRMLRNPKVNTLPAAQALYQLLLAPVEKDLEQAGAKNIMLSLDGPLRYLPFSALHDGRQHLVQRWNMPMYTSVTKNKLRDAVTPQWQAAGLGLTRAVGKFSALPAVKAEMSSIVKTGVTGVLPGEVYLDEAFNAARFKDVSQRKFQLLHVASHFQFSPGTEINSFLLLGDGQQLTLGDIRTQNYRFDNVDLLTLSACDTGLGGGRDAQGREIEGFGVIAQQQGAKAVLATLWPVADQSTATLMADMYKQRQDKSLTKIEALRQAQISLLSQPKYAHPFYWAPFILMGNWK